MESSVVVKTKRHEIKPSVLMTQFRNNVDDFV